MAKKTLDEMLEESTVKPGTKDATRRLATFLAHWGEMEEAYRKGWSWLQIYNALFQAGVIDFSYSTFRYYKAKKRRREREAAKSDPKPQSVVEAKGGVTERPARPPGSTKIELPTYKEVPQDREVRKF